MAVAQAASQLSSAAAAARTRRQVDPNRPFGSSLVRRPHGRLRLSCVYWRYGEHHDANALCPFRKHLWLLRARGVVTRGLVRQYVESHLVMQHLAQPLQFHRSYNQTLLALFWPALILTSLVAMIFAASTRGRGFGVANTSVIADYAQVGAKRGVSRRLPNTSGEGASNRAGIADPILAVRRRQFRNLGRGGAGNRCLSTRTQRN